MNRRIPMVLCALVAGGTLAAAQAPGTEKPKPPKSECTLDGQNFMAFGNYDPMTDSPLDLQGRVSYRCYPKSDGAITRSTGRVSQSRAPSPYAKDRVLIVQISLDGGNAGGFNRYMEGAGDRLYYNLYMDAERQTVWGDGTSGTRMYSSTARPDNSQVTVPVFGRIYGAQDARAGVYQDTVIVTLDF